MKLYSVYVDGHVMFIPQLGLKTWLSGCYLTYNDFLAYFYVEDRSWTGYINVLTQLYKSLVNQLNDFYYTDYVDWDGYSFYDTALTKNATFMIARGGYNV